MEQNKMADASSNSESDEFYDAEDATPCKNRKQRESLKKSTTPPEPPPPVIKRVESKPEISSSAEHVDDQESTDDETRRRRVLELRQRLTTDEDGAGTAGSGTAGSPQGSTTSSLEGGLYPGNRSSIQSAPAATASHPFRIIDQDGLSLHSMSSIGRGALLLSQIKPEPPASIPAQQEAPSTSSSAELMGPPPPPPPLQEPDVIASTKPTPPVAPPRRKKKNKSPANIETVTSTEPEKVEEPAEAPLPSPASAIESLAREFEQSLDLRAATKGQYVVKPQDSVSCRAEPLPPSPPSSSPTSSLPPPAPSPTSSLPPQMPAPAAPVAATSQQPPHSSSCSSGFSSACSSLPRSARPSPRNSKERNTGTPGLLGSSLSMDEAMVRTRTDSGKQLTDLEILEQVTVLNLDTGERVPLSVAEDKLPQCINPLNSSLEKDRESDEESVISQRQPPAEDTESINIPSKKRSQIRSIIGRTMRKTMDKAKHFAHEVRMHGGRDGTARDPAAREGGSAEEGLDEQANIKLKASHKGPYEFDSVRLLQDMSGEHSGAIWCMRFSACGRLLATAGQDRVLRVWVLRDASAYFSDMCTKYSSGNSHPKQGSPTPSQESLVSQVSTAPADDSVSLAEGGALSGEEGASGGPIGGNYFILSSSMDKTVRLWHISRKECLCCFQHIDFVTAIVFHPRDDRYFLSGSLDGKLRLWNIPDKKVAFAVVGSYDGRCVFYTTEQLKYHTQIHVRSSRGRNSQGRKITGIEPMPGEDKYKGCVNISSQIRASFSHDGKYITSGSENQTIYIWRTYHEQAKFSSARRDRNNFWEGIKAHNAVVTCSVFAPHPAAILRQLETAASLTLLASNNASGTTTLPSPTATPLEASSSSAPSNAGGGYILVSADFNGSIKVFLNRTKPKHSSLPASAIA
ncbi:hypothetical protein B566_EDAN004668 [Ephemera danica]|nr:hypothetical protein B566_EDAN004668 [Ephemera danica]